MQGDLRDGRYESPDGKSLPTVRGLQGWRATVRWESALPVRDAMKASKTGEMDENYIIALVGDIPARACHRTTIARPNASRKWMS